jgi:hypothetical protein
MDDEMKRALMLFVSGGVGRGGRDSDSMKFSNIIYYYKSLKLIYTRF